MTILQLLWYIYVMIIVCAMTPFVQSKTEVPETNQKGQGIKPSKIALERHEKVLAEAMITIRAIFKKEQPYRYDFTSNRGRII